MAITSLSELKTAVQNWNSGRADTTFTDRLDEFVSLAESRLNVELAVRTAEVDTSLAGTLDSREIALPSDFLEPVALFLTTFGERERLAPIVAGNYELGTTSGTPSAWMINGSNIDLDKPCDQAHTFSFRYRKKLFDLATTDPNWLLTNHPNVYLFAVLAEAANWEDDDAVALKYEARLRQAIAGVRWLQARSNSGAPLRTDAALVSVGGFNINSGD
ncbi:MAG: hypothetical protein Q8R92_03000 [Deltaproteobacteria bacterium]|nr:hypothetical protein [Deltaproteobacteria bacterium]